MLRQDLARLSKNENMHVKPVERRFAQVDTIASIADSMYAEYKEPLYAAPPLLQRMVDAGRLGRKSGAGFYPYS